MLSLPLAIVRNESLNVAHRQGEDNKPLPLEGWNVKEFVNIFLKYYI
jgi:hypothetical protein